MTRRDFLATTTLSLAPKLIVRQPQPHSLFREAESAVTSAPLPGSRSHEFDFASALQVAEAIRRHEVSSLELTQRAFERFDRYNGSLNAFAYQLREGALAQARKADDAQEAVKESS